MENNELVFQKICGDCAGVDMDKITRNDIIEQAKYFRETGEIESDEKMTEMIQKACDYLDRRNRELLKKERGLK